MKVDYSVKKKFYDPFPNQTWIFRFIWLSCSRIPIIYQLCMRLSFPYFSCNEPILSQFCCIQFIFNIYFYRKRSPIQDKTIWRILLTNKKLIIVSKVVSFFLEIQRIFITLYVGYQFCIIQKDSKIFIDMSVLYRKKPNYSFWKSYSFFN